MFASDARYDYYRCTTCDTVYLSPMPDMEQIAGFYPEEYSVYDESIKIKSPSALQRALLKTSLGYSHLQAPAALQAIAPLLGLLQRNLYLPYIGNGRLLDVGCGNGSFLLNMQQLGWQVEGVEFNDTAVGICRQHGLQVHHGDLASANLPDDSFDLVSARHLIEHVPDPHAFMADMVRVTRPGGCIHLRTPNTGALGRRLFGEYWYANDAPRHLIMYNRDNLDRLAAQHGLRRRLLRTLVRPKLFLNSMDYRTGQQGKPSRKRKLRRLLAKLYIPAARLCRAPDELFVVYEKIR
jgi:2-polyprenyl-3-methyl-5-hydroxy-6-metoxy-1,4-benzoquinol methylase